MHIKTWMIGLATLVTLGSTYLPLRAYADDAGVQNSKQTTIITGEGNYNRQNDTQVRIDRGRRVGVNSGTAQNNDQLSDINGRNNESSQENRQVSVEDGSSRVPRTTRTRICDSYYRSACY